MSERAISVSIYIEDTTMAQSNKNHNKNSGKNPSQVANMAKPTAAPTAAPVSAAPGTKDAKAKKVKKERVPRVLYPALKDAEGKAVRLETWPTDFDDKKHKPLRKIDFTNDAVWFEHKATEFDARAAEMRNQAELSRKLGSSTDRAKAKRFKKMQEQMAALQKDLESQGIDIPSLLAQLTGTKPEDALQSKV